MLNVFDLLNAVFLVWRRELTCLLLQLDALHVALIEQQACLLVEKKDLTWVDVREDDQGVTSLG